MYNEASKKATIKYKAKNYEKLNIDVRKGKKEEYKAYAASKGVSLTKLIVDLIEQDMKQER